MKSGEVIWKTGFNRALLIFLSLLVTSCYDNQPPVADAGEQINVYLGEVVELNGNASYDSDGTIKDYLWTLSFVPDGSIVKLHTPTQSNTTFFPDVPGVYVAELMVFDDGNSSGRDHVIVKVKSDYSVVEPPILSPIAEPTLPPMPAYPAMPPVAVPIIPIAPPYPSLPELPMYTGLVSEEIMLQGEMSNMPGIRTVWDIVDQPGDAKVVLSSADNNEIIFMANMPGNYYFVKSIYADGVLISSEKLSVQVVESIVSLGSDVFTLVDSEVNLNPGFFLPIPPAGYSTVWEIVSKPESSAVDISDINGKHGRFFPDVAGSYEVRVVVTLDDGTVYEDSVLVTAMDYFPDGSFDHNNVEGQCVSCHNGVFAVGITASHIATSDNCGACHSTLEFFPIIILDHAEISGDCENCHNGIIATGKSVSHPDTAEVCDSCHSTVMWIPVMNEQIVTGLNIEMITDANTYQMGDLIKAKATFTNKSDRDVTLFLSSPKASPVVIRVFSEGTELVRLSNPNDPFTDLAVTSSQVIKVGESVEREVLWDQMLPQGGLASAGTYTVEAFVQILGPDVAPAQWFGIKTDIRIEHAAHTVTEESALLLALKEPVIQTWYEGVGSNIMCIVGGKLVIVDNYAISPVATLVPVPESMINCHTELVKTTGLEWQLYFHSANELMKFSYRVVIDALTGEIKSADPV